jgi:hypothetical protein
LRERIALEQSTLAKLPAGDAGAEARRASLEAVAALEHQAALSTERHQAAMVRLGSSTESWAAGARVAFQGWLEQHSAFNTAANAMTNAINGIGNAAGTMFQNFVSGAKSGKDAMKEMLKNFIASMAQMIVQMMAVAAVLLALSFIPGFATVMGFTDAAAMRRSSFGGGGGGGGGALSMASFGASMPKSAGLMTMPGGKPAMGGGAAKSGGDTYIINQIQAIEPQTFASFLQTRDSQDVLSGQMSKNLRGNSAVRGAARS